MTDALQNLVHAMDDYRQNPPEAPEQPKREKNPYGAKIHQENMLWGKKRKAVMESLEDDKRAYLDRVEKFQELAKRWDEEHKDDPKPSVGRPALELPDEVKMLAAQALRDGRGKTAIRGVLGISRTDKLNRILAEGEELLQAEARADAAAPAEEDAGW